MKPNESTPAGQGTAAAAARPAHSFAGFDTAIYPGDEKMRIWKASSPYSHTAYYLPSPGHLNASWVGARERLEQMGWSFAVVYSGGEHDRGAENGTDAAARAEREGFPPGAVIFLDMEPLESIDSSVKDYVRRWFAEVLQAGYTPSLRCDAKDAVALREIALDNYPPAANAPLFWVRGGPAVFNRAASHPGDSGIPFAGLWQESAATLETHGGATMPAAANVASMENPSGLYVSVGTAAVLPAAARPLLPLERVNRVIQKHLHELMLKDVIQVRAGYRVAAGQPTGQPAIVVKVLDKNPNLPAGAQLPRSVEGFPVDVRQASPIEQIRVADPQSASALERAPEFETPTWEFEYGELAFSAQFLAKAVPTIPYQPASVPLDQVDSKLTINCHASPDCGWPNLKPFLEGTQERLTVGMYDIGSQHVIDTFKQAVQDKHLTMVLDSNPAGPNEHPLQKALEQELGAKFKFAWAPEATSRDITTAIFPNAYHIKVVVRDGKVMWLSSGNWMDSNQPDINPVQNAADRSQAGRRNREWHVIVDHEGLSSLYEKYLEHDLKQALPLQRAGASFAAPAAGIELFVEEVDSDLEPAAALPRQFFKPFLLKDKQVRIQPLLTPDNYGPHILALIRSAKKKFYMQTQYVHAQQSSPQVLKSLVEAIQERIEAGVDVRIIVHEREARGDWIERLQTTGFDTSVFRVQPGIHNKGMVVDSKIAVVGSQNWSGDGVSRNRDASLILFNTQIARYFEKIFLHDWTRLARPYEHRPLRVLAAKPGEATPAGFRRITLADYLSE